MTSPAELTEARRAYLEAGTRYTKLSAHVDRTGGSSGTRADLEAARLTLRRLYAAYLDASATAGAV